MLNRVPIAEHDSWLTLDLIWGCLNNCGYCYLRDSDLTGTKPFLEFAFDDSIKEKLAFELNNCPKDIPISIGNTTDILLNKKSREILYKTARLISTIDPERLIIVITKVKITEEMAKEISDATAGHGLIILSQSFSKEYTQEIEKGKISSPEDTYRSFEVIERTEGLKAVHFWRPFLSRWNGADKIAERIRRLKNSGCLSSVVIGLKGGSQLVSSYSPQLRKWAEPELKLPGRFGDERIIETCLAGLMEIARQLDYPIFRQTSCAIAFVQECPDINGTHVSQIQSTHCKSVNCPQAQRHICSKDPLLCISKEQRNALIQRYAKGMSIVIDQEAVISEEINEFCYNHLTHILHKSPLVKKIHLQKAWRGNLNDKESD